MKRMICVVLALVFIFLSGCTNVKPAATDGYTFTDALGREVTVTSHEKVAAALGSFGEVWMLAGGTLTAVTSDAWSERAFELPDTVEDLGLYTEPSVERVIALGCDLMLLSTGKQEHIALLDQLTAAGVNCVYFSVETFDDYLAMLKTCTEITGRYDLYEQNGLSVRARIDDAIEKANEHPSPSVLLIRAFSTGAKAKGSDNMTGRMLRDLNCTNIADSDDSLLEDLSLEAIIKADPDFIFVVTMGSSPAAALEALDRTLLSNPAWSGLTAVREGRYHVLPKDLFHYKPNARWGESYEIIERILYENEEN
ncbi:MAG: ABC transporter substrate-binding protein [Clostridiaceae bacterium]|nr:ABC transporter substrate-binding protein [Clostridiaceae bacterium]